MKAQRSAFVKRNTNGEKGVAGGLLKQRSLKELDPSHDLNVQAHDLAITNKVIHRFVSTLTMHTFTD